MLYAIEPRSVQCVPYTLLSSTRKPPTMNRRSQNRNVCWKKADLVLLLASKGVVPWAWPSSLRYSSPIVLVDQLPMLKLVQQLRLEARDVEAPGELARPERRERALLRRVGGILEVLLVPIVSDAQCGFPPLDGLGPAAQRHHQGLGVLAGVGVDDRLVRQHRRRGEELHRQADVVLHPAQGERG